MAYRIEFTDDAKQQVKALEAHERALLLDTVEAHLAHQPTMKTRNRKPMRGNPLAPWVLRIGRLRLYYGVSEESEPVVTIRAVGIKIRNRVLVGREEIELP